MAINSSNARRIQGKKVSPTAPTNGQALVYNSSTGLWEPASVGGNGVSSVAYHLITSSEILNAFTTPFDIISAPGANKLLVLEAITWKFVYNSAAYSSGNTLSLQYADGTSIGQSGAPSISVLRGTADAYGFVVMTSGNTGTAPANSAIQMKNGTSSFSSGNSTIKLWIKYRVIDLTTTTY